MNHAEGRFKLSLADLFARQDAAASRNLPEVEVFLHVLELALSIALDVTMQIGENDGMRTARPSRRITANILNSACAGLVSATRLGLFGDHVGALTLTRLALKTRITPSTSGFAQMPLKSGTVPGKLPISRSVVYISNVSPGNTVSASTSRTWMTPGGRAHGSSGTSHRSARTQAQRQRSCE